jgi:hypothetical protein
MLDIMPQDIDWQSLPNMGEEELEGYSGKDLPMFREVRDALAVHGCLETFGLYLIHKHFDIKAGEQLVEYVDFGNEKVVVQTVDASTLVGRGIVPTNWTLSRHGNQVSVKVAQWGFVEDLASAEREPFNRKYAGCFADVHGILEKNSALERFGMFLVRNQFDFEREGDNQLECTDQAARTLTLTRVPTSENQDNVLPTNWRFTPNETVAVGCCVCARNTGGHLGRHWST